jgi:osmotically-inducible protein OsmY
MTSDEQLAGRIRQAFINDERVSARAIKLSVENGIVTLTGTVQSHRRKLAAQELASSFEGCREVVNELRVVPPGRLPDAEVAERVRAALRTHAEITKETMSVTVSRGSVTLSGSVSSYWERAVAEDVALGTRGVRAVTNMLLVDQKGQVEDEALALEIRAALSQTRGLRGQRIDVAVSGDTAVLSGRVDALWKKQMAAVVTRRFRVADIRNDIVVSPA